MSYVDQSPRQPVVCPDKGSSAEELSKFLDKAIDYESSRHIEIEDQILVNKAYKEARQWLLRTRRGGSIRDYRRSTRVRESDRDSIPTPVHSIILEAVENEVSRLGKRNSEVYVEPSDASPTAKTGSKVATDVLLDHLDEIRWPRIRYRSLERNVLHGTMILKSFLQQDNLDTVQVALPGAMKCGGTPQPPMVSQDETGQPTLVDQPPLPCDFTLSSPNIPPDKIEKLPPEQYAGLEMDDFNEVPGIPDEMNAARQKFTASKCLKCGGGLQPYTPVGDELKVPDAVGRSMAKDVPRGRAMIEAVHPLEFYPENEGIGVEPDTMAEVAQCSPRSLDWVKKYFTKNVDQVKAEDPVEIATTHPIWGEYGSKSRGAVSAGERIYRNHVRVREYYKDPTVDSPRGRALVMAGPVVIMDDDLLVDSPEVPGLKEQPKPFPRVIYRVARCFLKDGELQGQGFVEQVQSDQNRINMSLSQVTDARERNGTDGLLVTRGMKLGEGFLKSHAGRVNVYDIDPLAPDKEPKSFPSRLMDNAVWSEIEGAKEGAARRLGTNEVDTGNAPKGVSAYSAIALLAEKSSERRQQREQEIIHCYEEIFRHQLLLMQRYYREPRNYAVKVGTDREKREFLGLDLQGETRAKVKEQPSFENQTAEREALAQNLDRFPEALQSPYTRREVMKKLGMPSAVFDVENVQLDDAEAKWLDFLRDGVIPVVDENLDNHAIFFDQYGRLLKTNEGKDRAKQAKWDEINKLTYGWKNMLFPPAPQVPPMPPMSDGTPPMLPPPPPPAAIQTATGMIPVPMDVPLQDQILFVWGGMLVNKQYMMDADQQAFLGFRSVIEAHKILRDSGSMGAPASGAAMAPPMAPPMPMVA